MWKMPSMRKVEIMGWKPEASLMRWNIYVCFVITENLSEARSFIDDAKKVNLLQVI